jgi:hypothetical protein
MPWCGVTIYLADLQVTAVKRQVAESDGANTVAFGIDDRLHRHIELRTLRAAAGQGTARQALHLGKGQGFNRLGHLGFLDKG